MLYNNFKTYFPNNINGNFYRDREIVVLYIVYINVLTVRYKWFKIFNQCKIIVYTYIDQTRKSESHMSHILVWNNHLIIIASESTW